MTTYKVNSKVRLDVLLLDEHLFESVRDPDTMAGVYSCLVLPHEGLVAEDLQQFFELEAGPHTHMEPADWLRRDGSLFCDSIIPPHNGFDIDPKDVYPGMSLRITFKPVLNYTPDQERAYGQLQLIGFDPYVDRCCWQSTHP